MNFDMMWDACEDEGPVLGRVFGIADDGHDVELHQA